jgi:outer membrane immunogenic protein
MLKTILTTLLSLAASAALAADMPASRAAAAPTSPAYDWSGFYVGVHGGYAAGNLSVTDTNGGVNPGPFSYKTSGGFGGAQVGYNWQISSFVIGAEGDLSYLVNSGSGIIGSANAAAHQNLTLGSGMLADATVRLGLAIGPALLYAKGGGAWFTGAATQATTNPGYQTTGTGSFAGWAVGGGAEYQLSPSISLKAEYLHYDFGSRGGYQTNVGDLSSPIGYRFMNATTLTFDDVKAGINYRF